MFVSTKKQCGVLLQVHVQPRSSRNCIVGIHDDAVKVATSAPPADGKANKALVAYIADFFGITKNSVQLVSGDTSRKKRFLLKGLTEEGVRKRVLEEIERQCGHQETE